MAAHCPADSCAAWICFRRNIFVASAAYVEDDACQPCTGHAGVMASRICGGICPQKCRTDTHGTVCVYAEPALPWVDDDRVWVCSGFGELDYLRRFGGAVSGDLSADDP